MRKVSPAIFVFYLFSTLAADAQIFWPWRTLRVPRADTLKPDSLFILPGSLRVYDASGPIPDSCYSMAGGGKWIVLHSSCRTGRLDSLTLKYRVVPVLTRPVFLKYQNLIQKDSLPADAFRFYAPETASGERNLWGDLNKNGSLVRGVTVGNNQDLALNSALNLQLEGRLAGDVQVRAVITDENIPLQPDGTQQNLQDFDKVFVEVWKGRHKAIAGDYFINRPRGYFLNIFKRAQGLQLSTALSNREILGARAPDGEMRAMVSGAIARGRFARNQFFGVEGKQGPYPLQGAENEAFIVVLSGTERVFIDGILLKRGQEHDYVIDYNLAQITFTARQLITKDRRIVVEFEYSDRNYVRTQYQIHHEWDVGKWGWRFNVFSEQDSRNQPLQQPLSPAQRALLAEIGDSLRWAVSSSAVQVDFSPSEVLYAKKDTIINGQTDTIFVYSTDPTRARWRVTFTRVGPGLGDYMPEVASANGRVFRYVGSQQGEYLPVIRLNTPKLQRMVTGGIQFKPTKDFELDLEGALSTQDLNLFSSAGNSDNSAPAFRFQAQHAVPIEKRSDPDFKALTFRWKIWHEYVHRGFVPFVRFRNVEFGRDWNLNLENYSARGSENLPGLTLEAGRAGKWRTSLEFQAFLKGADYAAWRPGFAFLNEGSKTKIHTRMSLTQGRMGPYRASFARHRSTLRRPLGKKMALEVAGEDEFNLQREVATRRLPASAYAFSDWQVALTNPDSLQKFNWRLFYRVRNDWRPDTFRLQHAAAGHNTGLRMAWKPQPHQRLALTLEYRRLQVTRQKLIAEKSDNALVTRLEYGGQLWKNNLTLHLFYETGSGFEVRRTLAYIPVTNGQGTHFWDVSVDYNHNGVADLDEFQPATLPGQGNYMRVLVNTGEFVKTFNNQFNGNFFLRMPSLWKNGRGLRRFLARWSAQGTFSVDRKTQTPRWARAYNPFFNSIRDTGSVAFGVSWRAGVFFNRNEGRVGLDFNYRESTTRTLLSNGPESRGQTAFTSHLRINAGRDWTLNTEGETSLRRTEIPFLPSRNYAVHNLSVSQRVTFQRGTRWRLVWLYQFSARRALGLTTPEVRTHQNSSGPECTINFKARGTLTARIQYIHIRTSSEVQGPLSFDLFDALAPGHNGAVGLSGQYALGKNLQLNLNYEGRFGRFRPLHNGGIQVRAFF